MDSAWIASIASQSIASDGHRIPSKLERIEKRKSKKRKWEDRKNIGHHPRSSTAHAIAPTPNHALSKKISTKRLSQLAVAIEKSLSRMHKSSAQNDTNTTGMGGRKSTPKLYMDPESQVKGKAVSRQQLTEENIQPIKSGYGGLGLARPSMLLLLRDPSFIPKIEEEFYEHIPGFFGKQRTNAMKKQLDGNMLWRRLQDDKKNQKADASSSMKSNRKKTKQMTPDEKVEAMIRAGLI